MAIKYKVKIVNVIKFFNVFEGDKYIVTWALGHLVTLADPEVYDQKYKSWRGRFANSTHMIKAGSNQARQ